MGKRIITQSRGHGSPVYRAPSHRYVADVKHPSIESGEGIVEAIVHDPGRTAPLAKIRMKDGFHFYMIAHAGMFVGQTVQIGQNVPVKPGNIIPIGSIPEGVPVYNIEKIPGDGGKFVRASGTYATIVSHGEKTTIQLPSGKFVDLDPKCRAVVGVVAGEGRKDKPFLKAGKKFHALRSKAKVWPKVRGVAMNAVDHPHGGGSHQHVGRPSTVSKGTPPGRKVGRIAPKKKKKER